VPIVVLFVAGIIAHTYHFLSILFMNIKAMATDCMWLLQRMENVHLRCHFAADRDVTKQSFHPSTCVAAIFWKQ
jgi:hypothetical protein